MQNHETFGIFSPGEVSRHAIFPWDENGRRRRSSDQVNRRTYKGSDGKSWSVNMTSHRYWVFRKSLSCASCGVAGIIMSLERDMHRHDGHDGSIAHFNLYAVDSEDNLVLMTKDHIEPVVRGGSDSMDNYQTMCSVCNCKKGGGTKL